MRFKYIETFLKRFNVFHCPKGNKVESFFYKNSLFAVIIFYNQLIACSVMYYERTVKIEKNSRPYLIYQNLFIYYGHITTLTLPLLHNLSRRQNRLKTRNVFVLPAI